jgi:predicted permease
VTEQIWDDVRLAWRGLRRAKGFAAAALFTLVVGISGTTTMFALVRGVLLEPLAVRDQDRLIVLWKELPSSAAAEWPFRAADITVLNEATRTIERAAGYGYQDPSSVAVIEDGAASYVNLTRVTGDFFQVLGVAPILGRSLTRADDVAGAEPVVVLTHRLWQRRYGGSPAAIGRRLTINEQSFTVAGVMPPDVEFPRGVEAWVAVIPLAATVRNPAFREGTLNELRVIARRRAGTSIEQTAAELKALAPRIEVNAPPGAPRDLVPALRSYEDDVVGDVRGAMLVLFGAVALVLLIATANVANLLLMRGESRGGEMAVRAALGASRARLARLIVAESVVLGLAAGVAGLAMAWATLPLLIPLVPGGLPRADSVRVDALVALFTGGAAIATAALAALAPVLLSTGAPLAAELRTGGRGATARPTQQGRRALIVFQIALAIVVLGAAGLLTRTVARLHAVGAELAVDRLMVVPLALPQDAYADRAQRLRFLNAAIEQLEASPRIASATPVNVEPFSGVGWDVPTFTAEGQSGDRAEANPSLNLEAIHPNYFETFEVAIVRGRPFTAADRAGTSLVAIVSEDVAARTWPGEDPIGKRLKMGGVDSPDSWRTVVGVAVPTRYRELRARRASLYVPAEQLMVSAQMLVIRTTSSASEVAALVVERLRAVDPAVRVLRVTPFADLLDAPLARPRFHALLIGVFAGAALFLAAVGVYTVMSAFVRLREREIGVRVALGASASQVRSLVFGEGCRLAGAGVGLGLIAATMANQLLRGLLFEVGPLDPAGMFAGVAVLIMAAAAACYLPARRATRADPIKMLRSE